MIKQNEGKTDRIIRIVLGAALVAAGFYFHGVTAIVLWVLGGVALFTGATGFCLLYMPFGITTVKK